MTFVAKIVHRLRGFSEHCTELAVEFEIFPAWEKQAGCNYRAMEATQ